MLGQAGVAAQLKDIYPQLISSHCFNHRLELSAHDAVKTFTEINNFKSFMNSLYIL